jgi:hypothetical protein
MTDVQGEGYELSWRFEELNDFERELLQNHRLVANSKEVPKIQSRMENRKSRQNGISYSNSLGIVQAGCPAPTRPAARPAARIERNFQIGTF